MVKYFYTLSLLLVSGCTTTLGEDGEDDGNSGYDSDIENTDDDEDSTTASILLGDWEGTCEFSTYDMDIELDIEDETWSGVQLKFEGDVAASFLYYGYFFDLDGDLEGELEADSGIEIQLNFGKNGSLEIVGEFDGSDTIDGDCTSGGVDARIALVRD